MLSPYFHLLPARSRARGGRPAPAATCWPRCGRARSSRKDVDRALLARVRRPQRRRPGRRRVPWRRELVERALAPDLTYQRGGRGAARRLRSAVLRDLLLRPRRGRAHVHCASREPGALRRRAAGGAAPLRRRAWTATPRSLGQWVGELAQGLRPGEVLLVVSGYGMRAAAALAARLGGARWAIRWASGTHADAPDGVLLAVGDGIRAGRHAAAGLRPRRGAHHPLPDGPARGARHGGPRPHRDAAGRLHARRTP